MSCVTWEPKSRIRTRSEARSAGPGTTGSSTVMTQTKSRSLRRGLQKLLDRVPDEGHLDDALPPHGDPRLGHRATAEALIEPPARVLAQNPQIGRAASGLGQMP